METHILFNLKKELEQNSDEKTKESGKRFFKEPVKLYGVKTSIVGKLAKDYFEQIKHKSKDGIFLLCEQLLKSDYSEEAFIAFDWSYNLHKQYKPEDFSVFETWVRIYVNNWAKCDTLCNHTIGTFIEMYPEFVEKLKEWAKSKNRWVKRAAAVSLILPARKGNFLKEVFEISNTLLKDEDDLVQKGYGWLLKEASRKHQKEVFDYVIKNKAVMPRTALRYAIEKMPKELKEKAMKK